MEDGWSRCWYMAKGMPRDPSDMASRVGRIMLRFRPIAPKPTAIGTVSFAAAEKSPEAAGGKSRGRGRSCRGGGDGGGEVARDGRREKKKKVAAEEVVVKRARKVVVGSVVGVEWVGGDEDERCAMVEGEARRILEVDTWPAFLTDGEGRVRWRNGEYERMAGGGGEEEKDAVAVVEVGEVELPQVAAFSCRVRLRYAAGERSMTAYCDVWRLRDGVMAWRVDSDAALTLGRRFVG